MSVLTKRCTACGKSKALDEFHMAKVGRLGRASRCKECLSAWHHANYLRKVADDPEFRRKARIKSKTKYVEMNRKEKRNMMLRIKEYRRRLPNAALGKNP